VADSLQTGPVDRLRRPSPQVLARFRSLGVDCIAEVQGKPEWLAVGVTRDV